MSLLERSPLTALVALSTALTAWLPNVHHLVPSDPDPGRVDRLIQPALAGWRDNQPEPERARLRAANPEWDLMSRTFTAYSLANLALAHPERRSEYLPALDHLIDSTLAMERDQGDAAFLLPYANARPWVMQPARSQFLDGEIALMLGLRRLVEEKPEYDIELRARVGAMAARMKQSPVLSAESYPDECWTFCNVIALAAIRVADEENGTDHRELLRDWVATAKQRLVEPTTGLLVSSYRLDGTWGDGPEGSSIWMSAHMLQIVDPAFAADQYQRAKTLLGFDFLGFGFSREWPHAAPGHLDIDSGLVVPLLEASPSASGMAVVASHAFGDAAYQASLDESLDFAAFPVEDSSGLRYAASNGVGDALILYASTLGPAWDRIQQGGVR